jgi:hypothetical protein
MAPVARGTGETKRQNTDVRKLRGSVQSVNSRERELRREESDNGDEGGCITKDASLKRD